MYLPLVKAFNYALHRLSGLDVPGLPKFRETSQIFFACSATKCIKSESYLQGSFKPDIVLVKWSTFKKAHQCADAAYPESYKRDICHRSGCDQPSLSWRNVLSMLEIKHGGVGSTGNKLSKSTTRGKSVIHSRYIGKFKDLPGDLRTTVQSRPRHPHRSKWSAKKTRRVLVSLLPLCPFPFSPSPVGTRTSPRNQGSSPSTTDWAPTLQKKRRTEYESGGGIQKKLRSNTDIKPDGTSGQGPGASREPGTAMELGTSREPEMEESNELVVEQVRVQSAVYVSHKISSSFDVSHTINLLLIGTWIGFRLKQR